MRWIVLFLIISPIILVSESYAREKILYTLDLSEKSRKNVLIEKSVINEYYKNVIKKTEEYNREYTPPIRYNFPFDLYDLNSDGNPEIITKVRSTYFCGNYDCKCNILTQLNKKWVDIGPDDMWCYDNNTFILSAKTKGYHDIAIKGFRKFEGKTRIWKWNGSRYVYSHFVLEK